jgi:hypothetical protein
VNAVEMTESGFHDTRHGKYLHKDMIGKKWGTRVRCDEESFNPKATLNEWQGFLDLVASNT